MTVIEAVWFSTPRIGALGIVCAKNDLEEIKFYLGVGAGFNLDADIQAIIDWGAKLDPDYVKAFFEKHLK